MTTLSQDTYATFGVPLTGLGGGSAVSTFDNLFVTSTLTALDVVSFNISTTYLEADNAVISSLSTLGIYLDGALLTTAGGSELLLNGVPVATTSNISSLSDWSLDPAISTVNMNGNNLIAAANISSTSANIGNISSLDIYASTIYADQSFALEANVSTLNVTDLSVENVVQANLISSLAGEMSSLVCSKIGQVVEINAAPSAEVGGVIGVLAINGLSTINGLPYIGNTSSFVTSSITAQSANFSSLVCQDISTVTLTAFSTIHAVSTISSLTLETNSIRVSSIKSQGTPTSDLTLDGRARYLNMYSQGMSNVVDRGGDFGGNSFYSLIARNGNAGEISMTAEPGILGNFGRIGMTANGGTLAGVGLGGLVEITATTPIGSLCNASSAIKLSAAGINSYAGAVPSIGSLTGYNFVYGTLGVNLTAGLPPGALPNTPGTVYMYGTNGVVTGSPLYAYEILGYWNGVAAPSNLRITGRQVIAGNSQVVVSNVDSIFFDAGYGALTGVSSINNTPYPPTFVVPANLNISSLNATSSITADAATFSTLNNISSVNGQQYPPTFAVPENLVVSTLVAADYVSTFVLEGVSSIVTNGDINIQANNVTTQGVNVYMIDPGGAGFSVVGGLTSIKGSPSVTVEGDLSVSTITNLSTVNGQPYIPYPGASAVSSITRAGGLVEVNPDGSITAASAAAATIQLDSLGQISLATSMSTTSEQMSLAAASTIYISSGSLVQMTSGLSVPAITNISSINNIPVSTLVASLTNTDTNLTVSPTSGDAVVNLSGAFTSTLSTTVGTLNTVSTTTGILKEYQPVFDFKDGFTYGAGLIGTSTLAATSSIVARVTLTTTSSCVLQATANFNVKALTNAHSEVSYYLNVNGTNTPAQMITTDNATNHLMNAGVIGTGVSVGNGIKNVTLFAWTAGGANTVQISTVQLYAVTNLLQV